MEAEDRPTGSPALPTDQDLVQAVNGGDADAFEILYFRYRDWVASQAMRWTGDAHLALDVLQETFLYLLRKFPGFELRANFKTFLYPVVRHLAFAARRKAARVQSSLPEIAALESLPAPATTAAAGQEDLDAALAGLSEDHREVLRLRFVEGLTLAEIALATEVPLGTVKSRLHHALATLRTDPRTRDYFRQ